jgi:hypothetical protein
MRFSSAARLLGAALAFTPALVSAQSEAKLVSATDPNFTFSLQSLVSAAGDVFNDPRYSTPVSPAYNGVAYLQIRNSANQIFACTGSLMEDGKTILTAAHCLKGGVGNVTQVLAVFHPPTGQIVLGASSIAAHPLYTTKVIDENDIGVVRLAAEAPANISRYKLYTGAAEGRAFEFVGYGSRGAFGGGITQGPSFAQANRKSGENLFDIYAGDSRFSCPVGSSFCASGSNMWENYFGSGAVAGNALSHILVTDFDNGTTGFASNDAMCMIGRFSGDNSLNTSECNSGYGLEEAISGGGDSGGPGFIDGMVASVTSWGATIGVQGGDTDNSLNSSFGEFSGFVDVAYHQQWLQGQIDMTSLDPTVSGPVAVAPEPSTVVLMASGLIGIAGVVRRRRKA